MNYHLTRKSEIRDTLTTAKISAVNFPEWVGPTNGEGEPRCIELMGEGHKITITATPYQTLKIEES